jgi:ubiquinone/menaquinone biosynthesis C-methylase UbiE
MLDYYFDKVNYRVNSPDTHFDQIHCKNVIHHVRSIKKLFKEFHRILRPEGEVIIIEPTPKAFDTNVFLDTLWYRSIIPREEVWFSRVYRDYRTALTKCQFRITLELEADEKEFVIARKA